MTRVTLIHGHQIEIHAPNGLINCLEKIFLICFAFASLEHRRKSLLRRAGIANDLAICEIHFVAGQLLALGSNLSVQFLMQQWTDYWDDLSERSRKDSKKFSTWLRKHLLRTVRELAKGAGD